MTVPPITEISYPFALAKKHPWLLFCRGGEYVAHRKLVKTKGGELPPVTAPFSMDIDDMPMDTRYFFQQTIADMKNLAPSTERITK